MYSEGGGRRAGEDSEAPACSLQNFTRAALPCAVGVQRRKSCDGVPNPQKVPDLPGTCEMVFEHGLCFAGTWSGTAIPVSALEFEETFSDYRQLGDCLNHTTRHPLISELDGTLASRRLAVALLGILPPYQQWGSWHRIVPVPVLQYSRSTADSLSVCTLAASHDVSSCIWKINEGLASSACDAWCSVQYSSMPNTPLPRQVLPQLMKHVFPDASRLCQPQQCLLVPLPELPDLEPSTWTWRGSTQIHDHATVAIDGTFMLLDALGDNSRLIIQSDQLSYANSSTSYKQPLVHVELCVQHPLQLASPTGPEAVAVKFILSVQQAEAPQSRVIGAMLLDAVSSFANITALTHSASVCLRTQGLLWISSHICSQRTAAAMLANVEAGMGHLDDATAQEVVALCSASGQVYSDAMLDALANDLSAELGLKPCLTTKQWSTSTVDLPHRSDDASYDQPGCDYVSSDIIEHWLAFDELHAELTKDFLVLPEIPDLDVFENMLQEYPFEFDDSVKSMLPISEQFQSPQLAPAHETGQVEGLKDMNPARPHSNIAEAIVSSLASKVLPPVSTILTHDTLTMQTHFLQKNGPHYCSQSVHEGGPLAANAAQRHELEIVQSKATDVDNTRLASMDQIRPGTPKQADALDAMAIGADAGGTATPDRRACVAATPLLHVGASVRTSQDECLPCQWRVGSVQSGQRLCTVQTHQNVSVPGSDTDLPVTAEVASGMLLSQPTSLMQTACMKFSYV
eukprot:jgi/Ulvmu1/5570/UM023_0107.1